MKRQEVKEDCGSDFKKGNSVFQDQVALTLPDVTFLFFLFFYFVTVVLKW